MVLSNTKLKRKKREDATALVVLSVPPDANDVKLDSPSLLPAKNKNKRQKSRSASGDAKGGSSVIVSENIRDAYSIRENRNVLDGVLVQKSEIKRKTDSEAGLAHMHPVDVEGVGQTLDSTQGPGISMEYGFDGPASEAGPKREEAPKAKYRKKPRWELDENGNKVKPRQLGCEGEGLSNGVETATPSEKGSETVDVLNGLVQNDRDAVGGAADAATDGDRFHRGDEPWLQSRRIKNKRKLIDRWGKKLNDAEAVCDDLTDNQEAFQVNSSSQEKVDPKKVVVGGMPYYISEDDIHEFFQDCGTVVELDCMTFPDTGKFKGISFITFRTEEAAKRAVALDGADMGGRFLKIEICKLRPRETAKKDAYKEPPKKSEGCLSAYIGNLSWDVTERDLRKFFKGCKIDSIRFAVNKETGEFRGFGHVDFEDDESLEAAMKMDQMVFLDRPLKIAYSVPPRFKSAEGRPRQPGDRKKGCFTCGEEGHMSYNCPKKR